MPLVVPGIHSSLAENKKNDWLDELMGKKLTDSKTDELSFAKQDLPPNHRILGPDTTMIPDYQPDRLIIRVDDEGTVRDVRYG
ncbi:hypothetical protein TMatcc_000601 [Talaromyces marneffei ATCC 18224]|uniref:Proteinase inhibitor I78 n=1 Tax=Talaromyces marneffei (strain ATCC 18224 / CBS 334.59 / QM 7333) TaxID=441960 RepID=B6QS33_TALMQ|nr:uncharacterized protein EYB26_003167 [Talaromyces marneffei]EEA20607.1 conserved hypothetical protein [Talaromyces marneffei ATCC 18224]KAE8549584.1 hypothetical protein EYB25_008106 [Talaromyces marneffei]QGA15509.1 hypothetical protein EYB26_003167 [Talaromyces marneffei]